MSSEALNTQSSDQAFENRLRPKRFEDFPGQEQLCRNLRIYIEAARKRGEPLDHILFSGPSRSRQNHPGRHRRHRVGRGVPHHLRPGPGAPGRSGRPAHQPEGRPDPLCGRNPPALGGGGGVPLLGHGGLGHRHRHGFRPLRQKYPPDHPRFTLIGATTRDGLLTAPFRARFGILERLDYYAPGELVRILRRSAAILGVSLPDDGALELAKRCRGTPRIANRFLSRARDVAEVTGDGVITAEVAAETLRMLGVDENGLGEMDRRLLETLARHDGGPVGLKTLAVTVGETEDTLENVHEPFLIRQGYLTKTPAGRKLAPEGWSVIGKRTSGGPTLF